MDKRNQVISFCNVTMTMDVYTALMEVVKRAQEVADHRCGSFPELEEALAALKALEVE